MSLRGELSTELTPREREVAALVKAGMTNARIAAALNLTYGQVAIYVSNIKRKQGAVDRKGIRA